MKKRRINENVSKLLQNIFLSIDVIRKHTLSFYDFFFFVCVLFFTGSSFSFCQPNKQMHLRAASTNFNETYYLFVHMSYDP